MEFADITRPRPIPNLFPTTEPTDKRIAIIGDYPSSDDTNSLRPFVGQPGRLLEQALNKFGVRLSECFLGFSCQFAPPGGSLSRLKWESWEVQSSIAQLRKDLEEFKPNVVLLLGPLSLKLARDCMRSHPLAPKAYKYKLDSERGSLFLPTEIESPFYSYKCLSSHHPVDIFRNYENKPLFLFDVKRTVAESRSPVLNLPIREYKLTYTADETIAAIDAISDGDLISIDIEGGIVAEKKTKHKNEEGEYVSEYKPSHVPCLSIATSPNFSFIVDFTRYSPSDEHRVMMSLSRMARNPKIMKILQNGLYDAFVLSKLMHINLRNIAWDTMLSGWEIFPEFRKGLGPQASIWTREPFWKNERKSDTKETFHTYCCKDSAVTYEIALNQYEAMTPEQLSHFRFNMRMLPPMLYCELRGISYDKDKADEVVRKLAVLMNEILSRIQTRALYKLNVNSPQQMCKFLYKEQGYAPQYKLEGGRKTNTLTVEKKALLKLLIKYKGDALLSDILWYKRLEGIRKQAVTTCDADGRVRSSYNVVGSKTGRLSCSASPMGTGMNAQTWTKEMRMLLRADPGKYFFQVDLSGADGWTVAAHCYTMFNDDTMLEDYRQGIKPAMYIALVFMSMNTPAILRDFIRSEGPGVNNWCREAIREASKLVDKNGWLYFGSKVVQHGTNYGLGANAMSDLVLQNSYKQLSEPIYLEPHVCRQLQSLYLGGRYSTVTKWQDYAITCLKNGSMPTASGHVRNFFGRPTDSTVINSALSEEPQHNTTYANNLGILNFWESPDNRRPDGSLRIELLHQVHDSINGQFDIVDEEWAVPQIRKFMNNPIKIGDLELTIPFEGEYGTNWQNMPHKI